MSIQYIYVNYHQKYVTLNPSILVIEVKKKKNDHSRKFVFCSVWMRI